MGVCELGPAAVHSRFHHQTRPQGVGAASSKAPYCGIYWVSAPKGGVAQRPSSRSVCGLAGTTALIGSCSRSPGAPSSARCLRIVLRAQTYDSRGTATCRRRLDRLLRERCQRRSRRSGKAAVPRVHPERAGRDPGWSPSRPSPPSVTARVKMSHTAGDRVLVGYRQPQLTISSEPARPARPASDATA